MPDRILVYGVTGSGKTTLAARIAERTAVPWHCVDDLTWEPGWVPVPQEEQRLRVAAICAGERWILDTAYSQWMDVPLSGVELVVGLDYARWHSLGRLLRRTLLRALDHRPICNGNTESFRQAFSHDSIIAWHFRSFDRKRRSIRGLAADPSGTPVVGLTSPRATAALAADDRRLRTDSFGLKGLQTGRCRGSATQTPSPSSGSTKRSIWSTDSVGRRSRGQTRRSCSDRRSPWSVRTGGRGRTLNPHSDPRLPA